MSDWKAGIPDTALDNAKVRGGEWNVWQKNGHYFICHAADGDECEPISAVAAQRIATMLLAQKSRGESVATQAGIREAMEEALSELEYMLPFVEQASRDAARGAVEAEHNAKRTIAKLRALSQDPT